MKRPNLIIIVSLLLLIATPSFATKLVRNPLSDLEVKSHIIVIGKVTKTELKLVEDKPVFGTMRHYEATVSVISILKGKLEIQSFTLPFTTCDIECFDVELKEGQKATFFLQSVEQGIATLSFPGGVAIFPEGYFY
ncbi:hypothetical protein BMS3Abin10_00291 [bacterium BMS3Abin10]|nr:hypothetical protein BMS3Abin10_00291 [bacterium BMS3Abin10]GBE37558.1 hypothetical protein BMS3Bbin08_00148 [bacterium BMS3Bbin08]